MVMCVRGSGELLLWYILYNIYVLLVLQFNLRAKVWRLKSGVDLGRVSVSQTCRECPLPCLSYYQSMYIHDLVAYKP